jgi:hypothetical protein
MFNREPSKTSKSKNQILLLCLCLTTAAFVSACATEPQEATQQPTEQKPVARVTTPILPHATLPAQVDVLGLKRSLGLDRAPEDLGYQEKQFNTCSVGYGYPSSSQCRSANLAVVHFRLQCRDSDGTVDTVTASQISPVISNQVKWTLGTSEGITKTDGEGFGQFTTITEKPSKTSRLKFTISGKFLIIRAEDAGRLVAPLSWCKNI